MGLYLPARQPAAPCRREVLNVPCPTEPEFEEREAEATKTAKPGGLFAGGTPPSGQRTTVH